MSFDQATRNRLQRFVSDARAILSTEFTRQLQQEYGIDPSTGEITSLERLTHLDSRKKEMARVLRDIVDHYSSSSSSGSTKEASDRMMREQAFTVLNRLSALRMAEARGIVVESLGSGLTSKGFQLYQRLAGSALGETGDTYRVYIYSLFDEMACDMGPLFDRYSPMGCLFPGEGLLLELLDLMNNQDIVPLWAEDETIGWIYQYFNSQEERRQMRAESQAPRNSRELAVRNQFFTPRYVVEFLTDNTLGRTWYEMTQGKTSLKDKCRYMVHRPTEIFLEEGEEAPAQDSDDDLSQEELLKKTVYTPFRKIKDPRDILMLDPACGSMHFGLYAFDLYETIYQEAWDLDIQSEELNPLGEIYSTKKEFINDIPRLIIEHNIHGIDIDPRAVQIAGLSLWLRAQRSWMDKNVKAEKRPPISKTNIVCAEPMPGEKQLLKDFTSKLKPKVLGQIVEVIFEKMELAGEAGSLLKIEEELADVIAAAKKDWQKQFKQEIDKHGQISFLSQTEIEKASGKDYQPLFDFSDMDDDSFWHETEERILGALQYYAENAEGEGASRRRLFAGDAARGFAFIDLCRKRYDVVLMNPPFGDSPTNAVIYLKNKYKLGRPDAYMCFFYRASLLLNKYSRLGAITSRTFQNLEFFIPLRYKMTLGDLPLELMIDLSGGVLDDATVETCASICQSSNDASTKQSIFINTTSASEKGIAIINTIAELNKNINNKYSYIRKLKWFEKLPGFVFAYQIHAKALMAFNKYTPLDTSSTWKTYSNKAQSITKVLQGLIPGDLFRFTRLRYEVNYQDLNQNCKWVPICRGGDYKRYSSQEESVFNWAYNGSETKTYAEEHYGGASRTIKNTQYFFNIGYTYPRISSIGLNVRVLPRGHIFSDAGLAIIPNNNNINIYSLLGLLNSRMVDYFTNIIHPGRKFEVAHIASIPVPETIIYGDKYEAISRELLTYAQKLDINIETNPLFTLNKIDPNKTLTQLISDDINQLINPLNIYKTKLSELNKQIFNEYQFLESEIDELNKTYLESGRQIEKPHGNNIIYKIRRTIEIWPEYDIIYKIKSSDIIEFIIQKFSYILGFPLGRWDVRLVTDPMGSLQQPDPFDPFDPFPVCPPGMLQNSDGLPAGPNDLPASYPLRISWQGILVNDEGHEEDIVARVREAMELIWKEKAGSIEEEACEILGIRILRDYFSKPNNFFADHLKRYSKSRRQAPIYWPLSTESGNYTLWIYYHRINDQILYACVNDFVDPKLKQIGSEVGSLRQKKNRSRDEEKLLEQLSNFEIELTEFRDELLRIAKFWKPNLNDGVQITASPLWKLFRLPKWQRTLKETWQKLEGGDYDWSHLAYSIWPERVKKKCVTDKSLAIAHGLEELYVEPPASTRRRRTNNEDAIDVSNDDIEGEQDNQEE